MAADLDREPVLWLYEYAMQPTGRRFKVGEWNGRLFTFYEDGELAGDVREECLVRSLLAERARLERERDALRGAVEVARQTASSLRLSRYADAEVREACTCIINTAKRAEARLQAGGEEE